MKFPLFPAGIVESLPPPPIKYRYFLLAYWPSGGGGWWKVHAQDLYERPDAPSLLALAEDLERRGWVYVKIMALPENVEGEKNEKV